MDKIIRNVIALYLEGPDQGLSEYKLTRPWMDYVDDRVRPYRGNKPNLNVFNKVREDTNPDAVEQGDGSEGAIYNILDYKDPSSQPKDQKGGPSAIYKHLSVPSESGHFTKAPIFEDELSSLKEWFKVRETDFTDKPEEQYPAMSLDNKLASSVLARYLLSMNSLSSEGGMLKTAVSLRDVRKNNTTPLASKLDAKARRCSVIHSKKDAASIKKGYFEFNVTDPSSSGDTKTVVFQFLKKPPKLGRKPTNFLDYDVEVACNCESFVWYGARYYAVKDKYMYMPMYSASVQNPKKKLSPPNPTNVIVNTGHGKGLNFRMCKHILAAMYYMIGRDNLDEFIKADERGELGPTNWKATAYYKNYPYVGPPSKVINIDKWKQFFGFDYNLENVKKAIKQFRPKIPKFFKPSIYLNRIDDWIDKVWVNLDYLEKISVLDHYVVEHPEQIFYILLKDAQKSKGKVPDVLIDKAFEMMSKVIKPEGGAPEGEEPIEPEQGTGATTNLPETGEEAKEKSEKEKFKTQPISPTSPVAPTAPGTVPSESG